MVVRDWAPLLSGKSRDEENEAQRILEWLNRPCDSSVVVFYMRGEADARKKLSDAFKKRDALVLFDALTEPEARKWIAGKLKPLKKTMSPETAKQLIFVAGNDLTRLEGELLKLAAYTSDRAEIEGADIEAIVSPSTEFGAFDMLNKLFDGDAAGAYETLSLMLERGTNRVAVLSSITRQMRGMAHIALSVRSRGKHGGRGQPAISQSLCGKDHGAKGAQVRSGRAFRALPGGNRRGFRDQERPGAGSGRRWIYFLSKFLQ